jgi:methylthioribose-1-phosphate isomerase
VNQVEAFFEQVISVKWAPGKEAVDIIDQTLLPGKIKRIQLKQKEEIWEAIQSLRVRGAPAIGVMAAYGMAVMAQNIQTEDYEFFCREYKKLSDYLASSRPTAVNLTWALNRLWAFVKASRGRPLSEIKKQLFVEAEAIREEDVAISRTIGRIGFDLLKDLKKEDRPVGILTHCNAGTLATAKYGTATAPMYIALEEGWSGDQMHVYCDETRPLLQGIRLTSFELKNAGIKTTVQCDNMASVLMAQGKIDIIFVGCDRVARNGDAANKIGTNTLAILAGHYKVPFYVCAPSSTIDMATATGDGIPIEIRDPDEITDMWYRERMAPPDMDVFNPAFDVTSHTLISGIITERGLCRAPFDQAFETIGL